MYKLTDLQKTLSVKYINGKWVAARRSTNRNLWTRLVEALGVFLGRYDAIEWPEEQ